jgi:peptidoglycan/xylan/chitin deacetylase (PgdA/CDA1 family)
MSGFLISLDFEMFWGVSCSRTIEDYGQNVRANWQTIPKMLELFAKYDAHVTWATVGMLLCRNHQEWTDLRPALMPNYARPRCSNYSLSDSAKQYPELFFARPLAQQILETPGQELGSHTYSHFYCGEEGVDLAHFDADLACADQIFAELNVKPVSLVFPRNQVRAQYLDILAKHGYQTYRGNPDHWLYRDGHVVASSLHPALRGFRIVDSAIPLTGHHLFSTKSTPPLTNVPCSRFLRPITGNKLIDGLHTKLVKKGMAEAAKNNTNFHLWAHPHNFGKHKEANLERLEDLLKYFNILKNEFGMQSYTMKEMDNLCKAA